MKHSPAPLLSVALAFALACAVLVSGASAARADAGSCSLSEAASKHEPAQPAASEAQKPNPYVAPTAPTDAALAGLKPNPYASLTVVPSRQSATSHRAEWIVGGLGATALVGGIVTNVMARNRMSDCGHLADQGQLSSASNACDSAHTYVLASRTLFVVAGAAALLDGLLIWRDAAFTKASGEGNSLSLMVYPGGGGLMTHGRF
jgi:hypothetical protein